MKFEKKSLHMYYHVSSSYMYKGQLWQIHMYRRSDVKKTHFVQKDHFKQFSLYIRIFSTNPFSVEERFEYFIMCISDRYHAVQYTFDLNTSVPNSLQNISAISS